jgi:hypothetical protein
MKNKKNKTVRSDRPSGRQTMERPEHNDEAPDRSSLHQGQGPDFQTQDDTLQKKNPGVTQLEKGSHQEKIDE